LQQVAFANAPKNQFMTVGLEATKGVERKGAFGSNTGVTVRHNGTVEIYGDEQNKLKIKKLKIKADAMRCVPTYTCCRNNSGNHHW
jgi:hypothetical protein